MGDCSPRPHSPAEVSLCPGSWASPPPPHPVARRGLLSGKPQNPGGSEPRGRTEDGTGGSERFVDREEQHAGLHPSQPRRAWGHLGGQAAGPAPVQSRGSACSEPSGRSLPPAKTPRGGISVYLQPLGMVVATQTSLLGPRSTKCRRSRNPSRNWHFKQMSQRLGLPATLCRPALSSSI